MMPFLCIGLVVPALLLGGGVICAAYFRQYRIPVIAGALLGTSVAVAHLTWFYLIFEISTDAQAPIAALINVLVINAEALAVFLAILAAASLFRYLFPRKAPQEKRGFMLDQARVGASVDEPTPRR